MFVMIFDYTFVVKISHQILHFISLQSLFGRVGRVTIRWVLTCFPGSWRRVGRVIDEVPTVSPGHIASQDATSNLAPPLAGGRALHPLGRGECSGQGAMLWLTLLHALGICMTHSGSALNTCPSRLQHHLLCGCSLSSDLSASFFQEPLTISGWRKAFLVSGMIDS